LTHGKLYTILTNKSAKVRKGSIVAIVAGTSSDKIIPLLQKTPLKQRKKVTEITLDMTGSMNLITKKCFPNVVLVTERFHAQKLAIEGVQELRIKHRWESIDRENEQIEKAKKNKKAFRPVVLPNGDSIKQLLVRSRYLLFKNQNKWTEQQSIRSVLLFELYPDIKKAYELSQSLRNIFYETRGKIYATKAACQVA
jgi:transposase